MKFIKQSLSLFLSFCLVLATAPGGFAQQADQSAAQPPAPADQSAAQPPVHAAQQTPEQLQQLVAPIALYPDALVAQILAAATYPDQIVEADRWMEKHKDLKGEKLGKEVDKQPWDPSVKALTEFPSVLANMDKNLEWTSSLGDAYVNQQQQVMDAVQTMRDRAEKAGNLKSNSQENVTTQDQKIVIEPADPQVVYVPEYDPWLVYGAPIGIWPGCTAIRDFTSGYPESRLAWASELASLAGLVGDGDTGASVGMAVVESCSTMAPGYLTAECSPIAASITVDFMVADSVVADFMAPRDFTAEVAPIRELSVASIMEETRTAFPHAGNPASVEVSTGVEVSMGVVVASTAAAVVGAVDSLQLQQTQLIIWRNNSCARIIRS